MHYFYIIILYSNLSVSLVPQFIYTYRLKKKKRRLRQNRNIFKQAI